MFLFHFHTNWNTLRILWTSIFSLFFLQIRRWIFIFLRELSFKSGGNRFVHSVLTKYHWTKCSEGTKYTAQSDKTAYSRMTSFVAWYLPPSKLCHQETQWKISGHSNLFRQKGNNDLARWLSNQKQVTRSITKNTFPNRIQRQVSSSITIQTSGAQYSVFTHYCMFPNRNRGAWTYSMISKLAHTRVNTSLTIFLYIRWNKLNMSELFVDYVRAMN